MTCEWSWPLCAWPLCKWWEGEKMKIDDKIDKIQWITVRVNVIWWEIFFHSSLRYDERWLETRYYLWIRWFVNRRTRRPPIDFPLLKSARPPIRPYHPDLFHYSSHCIQTSHSMWWCRLKIFLYIRCTVLSQYRFLWISKWIFIGNFYNFSKFISQSNHRIFTWILYHRIQFSDFYWKWIFYEFII